IFNSIVLFGDVFLVMNVSSPCGMIKVDLNILGVPAFIDLPDAAIRGPGIPVDISLIIIIHLKEPVKQACGFPLPFDMIHGFSFKGLLRYLKRCETGIEAQVMYPELKPLATLVGLVRLGMCKEGGE